MKEQVTSEHSPLTKAAVFLKAIAPRKILRVFRPDCCVAATRIGVAFMSRLGFNAHAQPTMMTVFTNNLWQRVENQTFDGQFRPGEWSVAIGYGTDNPRPDGIDMHLVTMASDDTDEIFLIDLSFGQASRPQRGLTLPPSLAVRMDWDWPVNVITDNWTARYKPMDNLDYLRGPDWTEPERTEPIIESLLREYHAQGIP
jgi:hypothetical protein